MKLKRSINSCYLYCFLITILLILFRPVILHAAPLQTNTVTGRVVSATDNEPRVGVTVFAKGTTNGSVTDLDGRYAIQADRGQLLIFSYVGFVTQEVIVRENVTNVRLEEDAEVLEELVVIGYGVQAKNYLLEQRCR